jgi:D-proline reductase (dithiol) PrdB
MAVDSYKYLPRSFRQGYEGVGFQADTPVWSAMPVRVREATVALLTSAGLYLKDSQPAFDEARERENPTWGDPTYRVIPRATRQDEVAASHLHLNTRDFYSDFNVALPLRRFEELEAEGRVGRLAEENYSVMGFQDRACKDWRETYGPEIAKRLKDGGVHALVLAPA